MQYTQETLPQLAAQAAEYCAQRGYPGSGTVVFYNGEIAGWMNTLRDPQHWAPGCIAVSPNNIYHLAGGGNDYDGATEWQPIAIQQPATQGEAPVKIGQYWPGQGGYYAGIMRDGNRQWHLIAADKAHTISTAWGEYPHEIPGEFSPRDGLHNTQLILANEPKNTAALYLWQLEVDGIHGYYWPAQCELNLLFTNLPELFQQEWHWSSTQVSAYGAWVVDFGDGGTDIDGKDYKRAVRAVRRLPIE